MRPFKTISLPAALKRKWCSARLCGAVYALVAGFGSGAIVAADEAFLPSSLPNGFRPLEEVVQFGITKGGYIDQPSSNTGGGGSGSKVVRRARLSGRFQGSPSGAGVPVGGNPFGGPNTPAPPPDPGDPGAADYWVVGEIVLLKLKAGDVNFSAWGTHQSQVMPKLPNETNDGNNYDASLDAYIPPLRNQSEPFSTSETTGVISRHGDRLLLVQTFITTGGDRYSLPKMVNQIPGNRSYHVPDGDSTRRMLRNDAIQLLQAMRRHLPPDGSIPGVATVDPDTWKIAVGTGAAAATALAALAKAMAAAARRRPEEDEDDPEDEELDETVVGHLLHLSTDRIALSLDKASQLEIRVFEVSGKGSYRPAKGAKIEIIPPADWMAVLDLQPISGSSPLTASFALAGLPDSVTASLRISATTSTGSHSASVQLIAPVEPTLECEPESIELLAESGKPKEIIIWIENAADQAWQFTARFGSTEAPVSLKIEDTENPNAKRLVLTDTIPAGTLRPGMPRQGFELIIQASPADPALWLKEPLQRRLTVTLLTEGLYLWSSTGTHRQTREIQANEDLGKTTRIELQAIVIRADGTLETNPAALNLQGIRFHATNPADKKTVNLADAAQLRFDFDFYRHSSVPGVVFQAVAAKALPGNGKPEALDFSASLPDQSAERFTLPLPLALKPLNTEPGSPAWQIELERCQRIIEAYIPAAHRPQLREKLAKRQSILGAEGLYELRQTIWSIAYNLILAEGGEGYKNEALWADRVVTLFEWTQWGADLAFGAVSGVALGPYAPFAQTLKTQITSALVAIAEDKTPESWLDFALGNVWEQLKSMAEGKIIDPDMISKLGTDKKALIWAVYCTYYFSKAVWYDKKSLTEAAIETCKEVGNEVLASFLGQRVANKYSGVTGNPTDPQKPGDSSKSSDQQKPLETQKTTNPQKPLETQKTIDPPKLVDPQKPVEDPTPGDYQKPAEAQKPAETDKPVEPSPSSVPQKPVENEKPAETAKAEEPQKPVEPETPATPEKPAPSQKPVPPKKPAVPSKPSIEQRTKAWEEAQKQGKEKVETFKKKLKSGTDAEKRAAALEIQADKQAIWEINRSADDATKCAMNAEMQKIYEQTDARTKQELAEQLNAERKQRIAAAEKSGNKELADLLRSGRDLTAADIKVFNPTNPSTVVKVGADRDVTMRYRPQPGDIVQVRTRGEGNSTVLQHGRVNPDGTVTVKGRDGQAIKVQPGDFDVPSKTLKSVYEKNFYEAATGKKAPADAKERADFAEKHDQACTDSQHKESYGRHASDLNTAMKKPGRDFSDPEQVGQAIAFKGQERFAKAEQLRKAGRHGEAETELAEGMRQTTKQWKNQIEKRRIAAHGKLDPDTRVLPPDARLQKAIDIMNEVGDGKLSPAQAESQLKEVGYTPNDVAHDVGKQLEMLQKLFPG
jgi:hypothetical protein